MVPAANDRVVIRKAVLLFHQRASQARPAALLRGNEIVEPRSCREQRNGACWNGTPPLFISTSG
ncbi:hypothetical protein ACPOL_3667 [Acidisarcina polymorpha]|uniref:Uncharacterized protein n=1 Tax=Acidisarcina polymorpha TaxID=2211140 RepID=A0A2Z5G1J1_9BACT|nr:hypothetical protein ACPOL_3667 [Acidisarcina polymorpha]